MDSTEKFKADLEGIRSNYLDKLTEPKQSIFNLSNNSKTFESLTDEVDSAYRNILKNDPTAERELNDLSVNFLSEMSSRFLGGE